MLRALMVVLLAVGGAGTAGEAQSPTRLADLDLPLTLQEPAGVERKGDLCSTGVLLPLGVIQEPVGIAVYTPSGTAVPAQFRVLERWLNFGEDKSVKWLLVTFMADVPKGGNVAYRLKAGNNPAPAKPVKIEEKGDAYEMGGQVLKKDFSGPFKLVFTAPDDKQFTAADLPVTWSIWENGPVRACLKAESPTVPDKFGFIAWVYAYAGQDRWDMTVVLKNTPRKFRGALYLKDFSVIWEPPELKGAKDFLLGGEAGKAASGQLNGTSAYLYQGSDGTDKWQEMKRYGRHMGLAGATPEFRGYKTFAGGKELAAGNVAQGWAALNGGGRGALACTRYFRPQFPKAVEVEPGRIIVRLWPKQWKPQHWLDDMSRKAHDISFRLTSQPVTAQQGDDAAKGLDSFLVAVAEQNATVLGKGRPWDGGVWQARQDMGDWVVFGAELINDFRHCYGSGGSGSSPAGAYLLFSGMRTWSSMVPMWVDDYQYPRDAKMLKHSQYCNPIRPMAGDRATPPPNGYPGGEPSHSWCPWNHAHFLCEDIWMGWRLFGDPLAYEAVKGVGVYCQSYVDYREGPKWKENIPVPAMTSSSATWVGGGGLGAGSRADGLPLHNLCQAYAITGDESMLASLRRFAAVSWRQVYKDHGYYAPGVGLHEVATEIAEDPSCVGQVMDGLISYYNVTHDETAADEITGMLDWVIAEGSIDKYGHFYWPVGNNPKVWIAERDRRIAENRKSSGSYRFEIDPFIYAFAYRYTGDKYYKDEWLRQMEGLKEITGRKEIKDGTLSGWLTALHFQGEKNVSDIISDPGKGRPPEPVNDLVAEALGGGKVKLTWTAPKGESARYQVKWADKRIVERLLYDPEKGSFAFGPKGHANWWAANDVEAEPKPGAAGAKESMTVEGVTPGKQYFAIRSFSAASNRSGMSNVVEMEVK